MNRSTWLTSLCILVVALSASAPKILNATPTAHEDAKGVAAQKNEAVSDDKDQHVKRRETTRSSKHPFDLGGLIPQPEVTPMLLLLGGGSCPGALPSAEQVAATKISVKQYPREIKREYFLKSILFTYGHQGQNVKVKNPEVMRDFFQRTISHLKSRYPSAKFSERLKAFTCVLADEDAGCERIVCVAPPTQAYTDGSSPEQLWVVTNVAYGNVRSGE